MLGLTENNPASAIVPELAPVPGEYVVRKTVPSAFAGTPLAAWFVSHGVQTVVVAGCVTSGCVRASVLDAMQAGFRPIVISDCVGDRSGCAGYSGLYGHIAHICQHPARKQAAFSFFHTQFDDFLEHRERPGLCLPR